MPPRGTAPAAGSWRGGVTRACVPSGAGAGTGALLSCGICYSVGAAGTNTANFYVGRMLGPDQHQAPLMSERIGMEPPRSRHDRVTEWMAANGVDALVAARADLVAWLAGYSDQFVEVAPAAVSLLPKPGGVHASKGSVRTAVRRDLEAAIGEPAEAVDIK